MGENRSRADRGTSQQGGTVGFLSEEKTIRFEVNLDVAQRARLNISATLLSVAKTVINTAGGK